MSCPAWEYKKNKMLHIDMSWALQNAIDDFDVTRGIDVSVRVHAQDAIRNLTQKEERLWEKLTSMIEDAKK